MSERCEFCGHQGSVVGPVRTGERGLCVRCRRLPLELRERLGMLLDDLRALGVRAFIRVEVGGEADDG